MGTSAPRRGGAVLRDTAPRHSAVCSASPPSRIPDLRTAGTAGMPACRAPRGHVRLCRPPPGRYPDRAEASGRVHRGRGGDTLNGERHMHDRRFVQDRHAGLTDRLTPEPTALTRSPEDVFPRTKAHDFRRSRDSLIASMRSGVRRGQSRLAATMLPTWVSGPLPVSVTEPPCSPIAPTPMPPARSTDRRDSPTSSVGEGVAVDREEGKRVTGVSGWWWSAGRARLVVLDPPDTL